jgi:hypothetical protein
VNGIPISPERRETNEAFMAELARLQREVRDLNGQLDRIEADLRRVLDDHIRERYTNYD